jgi:nicotinamidase-related amidase
VGKTIPWLVLCLLAVAASVVGASADEAVQTESCVAALVVINLDSMTVGFAGTGDPFPEDWRTASDRHVVEANADLIPAARDAGLLIIYLYGSYSYVPEGEEMDTYADEIAPQEGDIRIARPGSNVNVFTETILLETLQERGIERLLFSGLNTGYCINWSSQWGFRLGFDVTVVADAHSGGASSYAATYNDYWAGRGLRITPIDQLDFEALCAPPLEADEETSEEDT